MLNRGLTGEAFEQLAGQLLQSGAGIRFRAAGDSMRPFILDGDFLEVIPTGSRAPSRGDILLVRAVEGILLAHRVVSVKSTDREQTYLIKGDSCPQADGWFSPLQVLGRVVFIEHGLQRIHLDTPLQRLRAKIWVWGTPAAPVVQRLPVVVRKFIRRVLFGIKNS